MPYYHQSEDENYHEDEMERLGAYIDSGNFIIPNDTNDQTLKFIKTADRTFQYFIYDKVPDKLKNKFNQKGIRNHFNKCLWYFKDKLTGGILPDFQFIKLRPSLLYFFEFLSGITTSELQEIIKIDENLFPLETIKFIKAMGEKEDDTFKRRARKSRESIEELVRGVYQVRARVLVLRLDLGYRHNGYTFDGKPSNVCQAARENIDLICKHRNQFVKHLRKKFKKSLLGYVWRLEYGEQKGYHLHVLIMLDGNMHQQDVAICRNLGEHWSSQITSKKGVYYNCNARKSKYLNLAIGMTNYANFMDKPGIDNIINYFVKDDWLFQVKARKGHLTMSRSEVPKQEETPRGRKRTKQVPIEAGAVA